MKNYTPCTGHAACSTTPGTTLVKSSNSLDALTCSSPASTFSKLNSKASSRIWQSEGGCTGLRSSSTFKGYNLTGKSGQRVRKKTSANTGIDGKRGGRWSSTAVCSFRPRSPYDDDYIEGDRGVQDVLVEMLHFQLSRMRMTQLVDEKSEQLRRIAASAHKEYEYIADRAMKRVEDTGSKVLRRLDIDAIAIDKDLQLVRTELEAHTREFYEVEERMSLMRNEGLFFKNLYERKPNKGSFSAYAELRQQEEMLARQRAEALTGLGATYRKFLYAGLALVIVSFIFSTSSAMLAGGLMHTSKFATYGALTSLLLLQLVCSQSGSRDN